MLWLYKEHVGNYMLLEMQADTCLCFVKDSKISGKPKGQRPTAQTPGSRGG